MIKKEFFEQYLSGEKDVELRNIEPQWKNSRVGHEAVLMCGKERILERE